MLAVQVHVVELSAVEAAQTAAAAAASSTITTSEFAAELFVAGLHPHGDALCHATRIALAVDEEEAARYDLRKVTTETLIVNVLVQKLSWQL